MVKKKGEQEMEEKAEKVYSEGLISAKKMKPDLRKTEPPLVDVKVTNPLTYIKSWWKKIIGNEGIDLRLKIRPLTAIAISIIVLTVGMGIGRFVLPFKIPFFVYTSKVTPVPTQTADKFRDTAFTGTLRRTFLTDRYYLTTSSSEAINLHLPENIDLSEFVGRRVFATGSYNEGSRTLLVAETEDLELLPEEAEVIPTSETFVTTIPTLIPTNPPLPSGDL